MIQVRAWLLGSLSKGTLTTLSVLPDDVIVLRRSMVKVNPSGMCKTVRMLVCNTSESRKRARLNANLIMLLDYGASRQDEIHGGDSSGSSPAEASITHRERLHRHLIRLQSDEKPRIESACFGTGSGGGKSKSSERKEILKQLGVIDAGGSGGLASAMMCAGHPLDDPYLATLLQRKATSSSAACALGNFVCRCTDP